MERKTAMRAGLAMALATALAVPAVAQGWGQPGWGPQQGQQQGGWGPQQGQQQGGWGPQQGQTGLRGGLAPGRRFGDDGFAGRAPFGAFGEPPADFAELDANGDGRVTRAELDARRAARFADADADGDGMLSVDEMVAAREAQRLERIAAAAARVVAAFDSDGDGALSAGELPGAEMGGQLILRFDADGDGAVSAAEFDARMPGFGPGGRGSRR